MFLPLFLLVSGTQWLQSHASCSPSPGKDQMFCKDASGRPESDPFMCCGFACKGGKSACNAFCCWSGSDYSAPAPSYYTPSPTPTPYPSRTYRETRRPSSGGLGIGPMILLCCIGGGLCCCGGLYLIGGPTSSTKPNVVVPQPPKQPLLTNQVVPEKWVFPEEWPTAPPTESASNQDMTGVNFGPGKYTLTVLAAMDLPNTDAMGKSDPYCTVTMGGTKLFSTPSRSGTLNPSWGTTKQIHWDGMNDLIFTILDSDLFTKDDWMAQYILTKDEIPQGVSGTFPLQVQEKFAHLPAKPLITFSIKPGGTGWFS
mmetsp:Transcript_26290/g.45712  ORF Transcript_26290/g.45712 Transcript_26290/m.45712 type:complete len:312 (-) Transcript_26290:115-1050(-)